MPPTNNTNQGGQDDLPTLKLKLAQATRELRRLSQEIIQRDNEITLLQTQVHERDDKITQLQTQVHERDAQMAVLRREEAHLLDRIKESKEEKKWKAIICGILSLIGNTLIGVGTSFFFSSPPQGGTLGGVVIGLGITVSAMAVIVGIR